MKPLSNKQKWYFSSISLLIIFGTFFLFISYKNLGLANKKRVIQNTEKSVLKELENLEQQLQSDFETVKKIADTYAQLIGKYPKKAKAIIDSLPMLFGGYNFSAIGIHPSPAYSKEFIKYDRTFKLNTKKTLWAPFYNNKTHKITRFPYDYTDKEKAGKYWYSEDITTGSWTTPYFGPASNSLLVSYRSPIIRDTQKNKNDGIICLDYALGYIQEKVAKLKLYRKGYGIIINEDSIIVSHPSSKYLGKKIHTVLSDETLQGIKRLAENKFLPIKEYNDRIVDRELYFKHILQIDNTASPITYTAIINLQESETLVADNATDINPIQNVKSLRLQIICGVTLIVSCIIFWMFILFRFPRVWLLISLQSLVYILGTLAIIYIQLKTPLYSFSSTDTEITNPIELDAYLNAFQREHASDKEPVCIVSTGFLIQNAKFSSANDLHITGYLWQKVKNPTAMVKAFEHDELSEILRPDFPEAETLDLELIRNKDGLIQWYFSAEVRQSFDYSNYPFDEEDIWLRIRPRKAYQEQLLFVPDFDSYSKFVSQNDYYLNPNTPEAQLKNGLEKDLFIKGWEIIRTSFSVRDRLYNTSFGKFTLKENYTYPELYFNITVKRRFLEVFVVYFIPILVTAFLLFTVLMTYTRNAETNELYGFNVSTVLGFCASLFFVIIVSHMSLRETLQTGSIIYLEYFFFCLYFLLSIVSIGAFFFSSSSAPAFFKKNNGMLIKMIYWPLFCLIILLLTTLHFSTF
ncbi:MAG: hypothetical protein AAF617_13145 [Bacteroidota bacterium]